MIKRPFILVFLMLALVASVVAQVPHEDLNKINSAYEQDLEMEVTYNVYKNQEMLPFEVTTGKLAKWAGSVYQLIGDVELLNTPSYTIQVDKFEKSITWLPKFDQKKESVTPVDVKALLDSANNIVYEDFGKTGIYTCDNLGGMYHKVSIEYDKKSFYITRVILFPTESEFVNHRVEIIYQNIKTPKKLGDDYFSWQRFLKKENNQFIPLSSYKDFSVHKQ